MAYELVVHNSPAYGTLQGSLLASLERWAIGFTLGIAIAVLLAIVTGLSRVCETILDPILQALRSVPLLGLIPLFIVSVPDATASVRGLSRAFGDRAVLAGLDLDITRGEFIALIGRSGSGKSTLLRALAGLDREVTGQISVAGPVSVAFQEPRLVPWKRVLANVALGLRVADPQAAASTALDEVGLAERASAWPGTLSGGEAQRASLARALVREPRLLLLDEPFSALDALTRIAMHRLVLRLWERHRPTVLLVTHDVDEALALADRVLLLGGGGSPTPHPSPWPGRGTATIPISWHCGCGCSPNSASPPGLTTEDVTLVNLQPAEALAAFASGSVDAWDIWPPYVQNLPGHAGQGLRLGGDAPERLGRGLGHGQVTVDQVLVVLRVEDGLVDVLAGEALDRGPGLP